jgi:hypothetical protein
MMTFTEKNVICCRNIESNDKIITFEVKKSLILVKKYGLRAKLQQMRE